jgi:LysM repeat protein
MYKWILSIIIIILLGATTYLLINKTEGNIDVENNSEQQAPEEEQNAEEIPLKTPKYQVQSYEVKAGDTLSSISEITKVSVETITWNNNLTTSSIKVGDILKIPSQDGLLLTVKEGDTVENLAKEYSVTTESIIEMNPVLEVGKEIFIPNAKKKVEVVEEPQKDNTP